MKRKIVLFDMDGVLSNYAERLLTLAHLRFELPHYVPEQIKVFSTESIFPKEFHDRIEAISHEPGFFESLSPIPYAVEAFHQIADSHPDDGVAEVFICTSPKKYENNPHCLAEKSAWVAKHLGKEFVNRIIFTRDKTLVHGHVLIDDKPIITGARTPDWVHVFYDAPYNRGYTSPRIKSWKQWRKTLLPLLQVC